MPNSDVRMFTSYSSVEQVMKQGIQVCRKEKRRVQWCFVVAYEGGDEVYPAFEFHITERGDIIRTSPSL